MKNLILLSSLLLSFGALSAEVVCTKDKRGFYRPTNEIAKDIASSIELKSCTRSDRFEATVKQLGHTLKLTPPKKNKNKMSLEQLRKKYAKKSN